jgi:hypothetical protein
MFIVSDLVDRKNIDKNYSAYKVLYNSKPYILRYDKDILQEVYFLGEYKHYWMSCRLDMKTISHYYIYDNYIKRYESGLMNRIYHLKGPNDIYYIENNKTVEYHAEKMSVHPISNQKLQSDLITFLANFNQLGLNSLFTPNESKQK